jgi:CheY-like chemotaxis protein
MTETSSSSTILTDLMAEGAPDVGGEYEYQMEQASAHQAAVFPTLFLDELRPSSKAETGLLSAVHLPAENKDDDSAQDDSRPSDETTTEATAEESKAQTQTKNPVIVIVEDTTELAEVIQATLERVNMVTYHETHGGRAIKLLKDKNPDVVLLDISLPDMTGWKILDVIKEKHESENTSMPVVIVITAYGDPANRLVGKLQGVFNYLIKPFTPDEVESIVRDALAAG